MESHRGSGLVLLAHVLLPPEARIHRDDAAGGARTLPVQLCRFVHCLPRSLCQLSGFVQVICWKIILYETFTLLTSFNNFREDEATYNRKVTIDDVLYDSGKCMESFTMFTWTALVLSGVFLFLRFIKVVYHFVQFYDIKLFFNTALKIADVRKIFLLNQKSLRL